MAKKPSKRITLRKKHKLEQRVTQHHKKLRKLSKQVKHKSRKDPGVPNSLPFKEEVLRLAQQRRQELKDEEEKKKEARRVARSGKRTLQDVMDDAAKRGEAFENNIEEEAESKIPTEAVHLAGAKNRRYYFKEFQKVVLASDVVLEVLDARDPLSCRCPQVEQEVVSSGKRLILILNKIDLIPKTIVTEWVNYLRKDFPTLPFKASTQKQRKSLGEMKVKFAKATPEMLGNHKTFGAENLLKLIGNYSRNNDIKTALTIGIIGLPNVGKSSVINSLKRARSCHVGFYPGVTRAMQEIHLDSKIRLLDSPGVIMQKQTDTNSLVLRNCIPLENVQDPISVITYLMSKMNGPELVKKYNLGEYKNTEDLLASVSKRRGIWKKGGVPHLEKAAKMILRDWTRGGISYYTSPPKQRTFEQNHETAQLVANWSKEFDIDALLKSADAETVEDQVEMEDAIPVTSEGLAVCESESTLNEEIAGQVVVEPEGVKINKHNRRSLRAETHKNVCEDEPMEGNQTTNKNLKLQLKQMKKQKRKSAKIDQSLAEATLKSMDIDYDFKDHFDMQS